MTARFDARPDRRVGKESLMRKGPEAFLAENREKNELCREEHNRER